jgi:hypothetical protein
MSKPWTLIPVVVLISSLPLEAQDKPAAPAPEVVSLKVQLVVSRFQGEKKVSSVPYTLSATAGDSRYELARLRIGTQVPIPSAGPAPPVDGKPTPPGSAFSYRDVGTNIDCMTRSVGDRQFQVQLTVEQTSVVMEGKPKDGAPNAPMFRSFRVVNSAVLKDGETTQFTTATDSVSGEIVRIDVTLNVVR